MPQQQVKAIGLSQINWGLPSLSCYMASSSAAGFQSHSSHLCIISAFLAVEKLPNGRLSALPVPLPVAHLPSLWHFNGLGWVVDRYPPQGWVLWTRKFLHKDRAGLSWGLMVCKCCLAQSSNTGVFFWRWSSRRLWNTLIEKWAISKIRRSQNKEEGLGWQYLYFYLTLDLSTWASFCIYFVLSAFLHLQIQWDQIDAKPWGKLFDVQTLVFKILDYRGSFKHSRGW